jgi:hypothetical protein
MKMYQFNCMDEVRQIELLWSKGALIGSRKQGFYKVLLYQVDSFYVEVFYEYFKGKMAKLNSFTDSDRLEPYLNSINIEALLNS